MSKITPKKVYDVFTEVTIGIAVLAIIYMAFRLLMTAAQPTIIQKDHIILCYPKTATKLACAEYNFKPTK